MAPENKLESVSNYDQGPIMGNEDEVKKVKTSKFGCGMFICLFLISILIVIQILILKVLPSIVHLSWLEFLVFLLPSFAVLIIVIGIIFWRLTRK